MKEKIGVALKNQNPNYLTGLKISSLNGYELKNFDYLSLIIVCGVSIILLFGLVLGIYLLFLLKWEKSNDNSKIALDNSTPRWITCL